MPSFEKTFIFENSPFEQYVAENEPNILNYAVVPPYFEVAKKRAATPSTHILFGARGAGKSATRLSTERELWKNVAEGKKVPLPVQLINFSNLIDNDSVESVTSAGIIKELSFSVIETLLLWISDQEEGAEMVDLLEEGELTLLLALSKAFYLNVPEANRRVSHETAMKVLRQNWPSKTVIWVEKRWAAISQLVGELSSNFLTKKIETRDLSAEISGLLTKEGGIFSGTAVLSKLVEIARVFGFSGISVFVDKVDEHPRTQNSPKDSAKLIHPIISEVQLMEVEGLGWQFFLWDRIRPFFENGDLSIRLDKLAHSEVSWTPVFLVSMIDARLSFFSDQRLKSFSELTSNDFDVNAKVSEIIKLAGGSPREVIRLLDTVVREFDAKYAAHEELHFLSSEDLDAGMDKYVSDVIWSIYDRIVLSQVLRLGKTVFINKDLQEAFKISPPGATNRIVKWEACGAVKLTGTRAAEGAVGGKPSNEYSIADPRIVRLAERNLYDPNALTEAPPVITD